MNTKEYTVGKRMTEWGYGNAQSITFIVTEDCNLRCKYCYITHKASNRKMSYEVAKKFIDYILNENIKYQEAVTLDFIGGEPLLEAELIDKICDYFKLQTYIKGNSWFWNYRISICTNGVNYSSEKVQNLIKKNPGKIGITITVDGTKKKHDLQRVFPDGSGSYDRIKANLGLWKEQFTTSTKVTFASDDLCFLKDSIIELWNEGIYDISANVVYEDVWKEGDDEIFENQLKLLADYILENHLFNKFSCTLFDDTIGAPYNEDLLRQTSCGAGKMLALGVDGKIYPCMRYCAYSLDNKKPYIIGDVNNGIDFDKVRPFETVTYRLQSDDECLSCPIATGCGFCQGFNYDVADTYTNFQRAKYICKMHKARVRANNYYFSKLYNLYDIEKDSMYLHDSRTMNFLLSNDYVACCMGINDNVEIFEEKKMSEKAILEGLKYAEQHFYKPVFIHSKRGNTVVNYEKINEFKVLHIVPVEFYEKAKQYYKDIIPVIDSNSMGMIEEFLPDNILFNISANRIRDLYNEISILILCGKVKRININILDLDKNFDLMEYRKQLLKLKDLLVKIIRETKVFNTEINVLTDILLLNQHENCGAGDKSITLGPDEKFYICPAFFGDEEEESIGTLDNKDVRLKNAHLYKREYFPICQVCDAYHCTNCVYHNKKHTTEVNVSSSIQCRKGWIERSISKMIEDELGNEFNFIHKIEVIDINDPVDILRKDLGNLSIGFYPRQ